MIRRSPFTAVDLFAGAGGLGEGFCAEGFKLIANVEMNHWACETLRTRATYRALREHRLWKRYAALFRGEIGREDVLRDRCGLHEEITSAVIEEMMSEQTMDTIINRLDRAITKSAKGKLNVLLGGPPCQPYSLAGRGRDAVRMESDGRHFLYRYYLQIIEALKPDFFILENVPGLLTARSNGQCVFEKTIDDFARLRPAYNVAPSLPELRANPRSYVLDSSRFGVPQKRTRIFLVGYRRYLKAVNCGINGVFTRIQEYALKRRSVLTVVDAIGDLPRLSPGEGADSWLASYSSAPDGVTAYQRWIRSRSPGIANHKARTHMEGDLERYRYFIEKHKNGSRRVLVTDLEKERPDLVPNHKHMDKFLDRFKVQWWERPSSTITAHIHKDGHYYIHPDISQCRSFTVREAARCQSFPDNYLFEGPRTQQFIQVGNAVPPRQAQKIAWFIKRELEAIYD